MTDDRSKKERTDESLRQDRSRLELDAFMKGSRAVLESRDFNQTAHAIFDIVKTITGATGGYVALLNDDKTENAVLFLDPGGRSCDVDPSLPMPIRGLREVAYRTGKAVYDNDFSHSKWMDFMPKGHVAIDNVLFAPLVLDGETSGLIGLANKPVGFNDDDARIALTFGELAAIALKNNRSVESLTVSENRFRSVVETAADAIVTVNHEGRIVLWNSGAEKMFGYKAEETIYEEIALIVPPHLRERHTDGFRRAVSGGPTKIIGKTVELSALRKDGSEFPIELSLATWEKGKQPKFTAIIRDISSRKATEEKLRENEQRYRQMFQTNRAVKLIIDPETQAIVDANAAACFYYGYPKETLTSMRVSDINTLSPEAIKEEMENAKTEKRLYFNFRHRLATGDVRDVEVYSGPIKVAGRTLLYSIVHDVTDRRKAEEAFKESEVRFRKSFELGLVGMAMTSPEKGWLEVNDELCGMLGYPREELTRMTWVELTHPDDLDADVAQFEKMLAGENEGYSMEKRFIRKDGESVHTNLSIKCVRHPDGTVNYVVALIQDITQRVRAEEALKRSHEELERRVEERTLELAEANETLEEDIAKRRLVEESLRESEEILSLTLDATSDGGWDWNIETGEVIFSDKWLRSLGYEREDAESHVRFWKSIVHPDDMQKLEERLTAHFDQRTDYYECTNRLRMKSGEYRWNLDRGRVIARDADGKPLRMVGTDTDITPHMEAQETLRRFRSLLDKSNDAVFLIDAASARFLDVNLTACVGHGYSREELLSMSVMDIEEVVPDEAAWKEVITKLHTDGHMVTEGVHRRKDGTTFPVEVNINLSSEGGVEYMIAIARDITERKEAEATLRESEKRFHEFFNQVPDYVIVIDPASDGEPVIADANAAACEKHGYTRAEFIGKPLREIDGEKTLKEIPERMRRVMAGEHITFETLHRRKDGSTFPVEVSPRIIEVAGQRPLVYSVERDITERKEAERALKESEERFRKMVENTPDAIFQADPDTGIVIDVNTAACALLQRSRDEVIGMHQVEVHPPEQEEYARNVFHGYIADGDTVRYVEINVLRADGTRIPVEISAQQIHLHGKTVLMGTFRDMSERKKAEDALRLQGAITENLAEGVILIRTDGEIVYTNPKFEEMFGYDEGELLGKQVSILNATTDKAPEETAAEIIGNLRDHGRWSGEILNIKKDGTPFWCYATVSEYRHPEYGPVWITVHIDIDARRKAEENLKLFRSLLNRSNDAIFVIDPVTSKFLDVNDRSCKNLGYAREELLTMGVVDVEAILPDAFKWDEHVKGVRKSGLVVMEGAHKRKDGTTFPVEVSVKHIKEESGEYMVAVARDIAERKKAEEERNRAYDELYEKTDRLERFHRITVGRELEMINLKKEVNALLSEMNRPGKYKTPSGDPSAGGNVHKEP